MDLVQFAEPSWFLLLGFAAVPWIAYRRRARLTWPTLDGFRAENAGGGLDRLGFVPPLLRGLTIICLVIGLARPQSAGEQIRISGRGVAIALVLDRSSSMNTADFPVPGSKIKVRRLDAAKQTLERFLAARTDDLIGVVAFANLPDTIAEPSLDRQFTWDAIRLVRPAGAGDDGTDIGGAIAWGLGLIRPTSPQHKVLILLTDGRHAPGSTGALDPIVAAEVAHGLGITLHTVAIGAPPQPDPPRDQTKIPPGPPSDPIKTATPPPPTAEGDGPDLDLLRRLAERGQGRSFVATDLDTLAAIFEAIDALESSSIQGTIRTVYSERFGPWVLAAILLIGADLALSSGRLRRVP